MLGIYGAVFLLIILSLAKIARRFNVGPEWLNGSPHDNLIRN
jgi:hypothetical protein